ncbi:hypothetical protein ELH72_04045 [Rhizobium ruizarguesonis]|nr:hypothetical protein ELH72_04045 [Rhizobium ruizarguesonis]
MLLQGSVGWGIFIAIRGLLPVSSIDNFLRPYLLNQNSSLCCSACSGLICSVLAFGLICRATIWMRSALPRLNCSLRMGYCLI